LKVFHLVFNLLQLLENISKGEFVPDLQLLLEVFEALLESVHVSSMFDFSLGPPGLCKMMEVRVREPKYFKAEGLGFGDVAQIQTENNGPMI